MPSTPGLLGFAGSSRDRTRRKVAGGRGHGAVRPSVHADAMDFGEALAILNGLTGKIVQVAVSVPDDGGERAHVATFAGTIARLTESHPGGGRWRVWCEDSGGLPGGPMFTVERSRFARAEVEHSGRSLEEVTDEDDDRSGTTWALRIYQLGSVTEVLVYL
jgi:hypothetical protein